MSSPAVEGSALLDRGPGDGAARFAALRARLRAKADSLPALFTAGEALSRLGDERHAVPEGPPAHRLAVLGSLTTDFIARAAACGLALEGVAPIVHQAPFGSLVQAVMDPVSPLHAFRPETALLCVDWRDLVDDLPLDAEPAEVEAARGAKVALFETLWTRLEAAGCRILQHRPPPPSAGWRGVSERLRPASPLAQVEAANAALLGAGRGRVHWLDLERLAGEVGTRRWVTPREHHAGKLPFDPRWLPDYLPVFRAAWRNAQARAKKALVLDLDNTLWGGVIGDDGAEGLALGPGSPVGEAFAEWQAYLKALRARGVILAVSSKNDPELAAAGFAHPHAALRGDDFAALDCSWEDKAGGLRRVSGVLNIGLDALVFADDNPAECALVRQALPEVEVVELGTDPSQFIARLEAGRWFEADALTAEDLGRAGAYTARAQAGAALGAATDLDSYLKGLAMTGRVWRPTETDLPRLAQLEQKTNQFNLTGRRYPEAELRALLARADSVVLAASLADRFGDHGLIASLIALPEGEDLRIDSWLMSCRVFSRGVEAFMLRALIDAARERGHARLLGERRPSDRNGVVADLYPRLGFAPNAEPERWARPLDQSTDDLRSLVNAVP